MNQSDQQPEKSRFAFIHSAWHREIILQGRDAFLSKMKQRGVSLTNIDIFEVPGAFEIPLHVQKLARTGQYSSIIACGFVVDGGIYRHEFVASAVISALMNIQLETEVPVISVVLTPQRFHDHEEHRTFFREHFRVKGAEAATACLSTVAALENIHRVQSPSGLASATT